MDQNFFESLVIRLILLNVKGRERIFPYLKPEIFSEHGHQQIIINYLKYYEKYENYPTISELKLFIKNAELFKELQRCIALDTTEYNDQFMLNELETWFREKLFWNDITTATEALKDNGIESIGDLPDTMRESLAFSFDTNIGYDFFDDFEEFYSSLHENENVFSTGLKTIDDLIDGGVHEKSITLFLAATNVGKTAIQTALGTNFLLKNKKVLYVTFEESEKRIARRFAANMFDLDINSLKHQKKEVLQHKFEQVKKVINKNLVIKEYPEGVVSANHIRHLLKELKVKKKFVPDIIFIDYIGCMIPNGKPNANLNSNDNMKLVCGQTRAISMEFGHPVISAMQSNRGGINSADLELTDTAESIGQTFKADVIFALTQTDELREAGIYTLILLKNRFGRNRLKRSIGIEFNKMRIYDLEDDKVNAHDKDIVDDATVNILKRKKRVR